MAAVVESNSDLTMMIDEAYEFSAPRFFDFVRGESEEDKCEAERWFNTTLSYAPSPCMPRIKTGRSFNVESLCDFNQVEQIQKTSEPLDTKPSGKIDPKSLPDRMPTQREEDVIPTNKPNEEQTQSVSSLVSAEKGAVEEAGKEKSPCNRENASAPSNADIERPANCKDNTISTTQVQNEVCTPNPTMSSRKGDLLTNSKKHQTAKRIASLVRNPYALKPKSQLQSSQARSVKSSAAKMNNIVGTSNLAQENQAIKRQKLEGGHSRQILNVKPHNLLHKSKLGVNSANANACSSPANKMKKEDRKIYVREPAAPFVSMAEMMKKFQSSTRDISLPQVNGSLSHDGDGSLIQTKQPKLTLTRPKEPELETAQRARSVRVKSTAELEEEMMAKIPKFKARPLNKKILDAPNLLAIPRSTPQPPVFQEFHLETMARANHNAESASAASTELPRQNNQWKFHLTEPKTPVLQTSLRARPPRVKSSLEIEQEKLEKIPKFVARPLNKKIFESKDEMGMLCIPKKPATKPQEFHFATTERIPHAAAVADLFDKLSISSEPRHENLLPKKTKPNPFHLHTEERGAEKERKFFTELMQKQLEEERSRIPRATPYPYTTDYPVIPPKPEPKECTKPEPFPLESLVRHEEEMQRELEERQRKEMEEAELRKFKAQPILKEDPIPLPEKVRKPLTEVQEFNLHVDHRAVDRAEFDQKIKEKEMVYKRYREESEAAKMIEEEKALKQLRRTLVPHARPVPKFDQPFCPQRSSKGTTKAKSPNLRVLQRQARRTMVRAAAAQMR